MKKTIMIAFLAFVLGIGTATAFNYLKDNGSTQKADSPPPAPAGLTAEQKVLVELYQPAEEIPELAEQYDVVVIGGEPEGVAAAVSAARNGSSVLLIERREGLGGLMTFGMLNFIGSGGSDNDLQVDEPQGTLGFLKTLSTGLVHIDDHLNEQYGSKLAEIIAGVKYAEEILAHDTLATYLIEAFSEEIVSAAPWDQTFNLGQIAETIHSRIDNEREFMRAEGYYLLYSISGNLNE